VPLTDFAATYDGLSNEPRVQEKLVRSQKELDRQKRAEEARKMRCDGAKPLP
jgi:hypothetical protein